MTGKPIISANCPSVSSRRRGLLFLFATIVMPVSDPVFVVQEVIGDHPPPFDSN
jgi:hypothetical protein